MADTETATAPAPVPAPIPVVEPVPEPEAEAHHDSEAEYESAEEIYEEEVEEEVEVEEEAEDGEGENGEAAAEKPLDDDEDRQNPQFIPKKGYFYEHDDRTMADEEEVGEEEKEEPVKEEKPKKKETERWGHDLYNEDEQAHKTTDEIVAAYGYDIRSDDQPPKAIRRRRYGRGPKKYTRTSDDAEAYQKPRGGYRGRGRRGSFGGGRGGGVGGDDSERPYEEDFPALPNEKREINRSNVDAKSSPPGGNRGGRGGRPPRTNRSFEGDQQDRENNHADREKGPFSNFGGRGGRGRRNEYSNRNRYPDRRESSESGDFDLSNRNVRDFSDQGRRPRHEHDDRGGRPANGPPVERHRQDSAQKKTSAVPPFSNNTEYTGSASLTAAGGKQRSPAHKQGIANGVEKPSEGRQDPRERRTAPNRPFGNERRPQPHLRGQPQSQVPPVDPSQNVAAKPKRFSTQRQRPVVDPALQQSTIIPQVVSVQQPVVPVVTGAATMVPSPVPNFTPQQSYYDPAAANFEPQVYDGASTALANGPSVSPSMWGPHAAAYATAPYPSPPAGAQVQVPVGPAPYADPAAFIAAAQPPGPPIYAAPAQYIQDPTMLNYVPPAAPQYAAPFHPPGYQSYPPVAPAPEVYHGGVTYYNTHNQIQRPPLVAVQKRPKQVLQLVEPPEMKSGKDSGPGSRRGEGSDETVTNSGEDVNAEKDLTEKFEKLETSDKKELKIKPPIETESWSTEMDQLSPTQKAAPPVFTSDAGKTNDKKITNTSTDHSGLSKASSEAAQVSSGVPSESSKNESEA